MATKLEIDNALAIYTAARTALDRLQTTKKEAQAKLDAATADLATATNQITEAKAQVDKTQAALKSLL